MTTTPEPTYEQLLAALTKIADFDVETMTYDGWNEWGEAEAWRTARLLAQFLARCAKPLAE